jgi:hypothetical protein
MQAITTIGLDIAKSIFQIHGVDAGGQVVIRRQLKRRQVIGFLFRTCRQPGRTWLFVVWRSRLPHYTAQRSGRLVSPVASPDTVDDFWLLSIPLLTSQPFCRPFMRSANSRISYLSAGELG